MTTTAIRLSSPADLLSAVPHLLGFHPTKSLTLLCLTGSGSSRLGLVARVDLPEPGQAAQAADVLLPCIAREDPDAVIVIAYGTDDDDSRMVVEVVAAALSEVGVQVPDRLLVVGQRWRSLHWAENQAWAVAPGPDAAPALEFALMAGSAPAASRTLLARRCAAGPRAAAVGRACNRLTRTEGEVTIERGAAVWGRLLTEAASPSGFSDAALALAALSLHAGGSPALRDALAGYLAPGILPRDSLHPNAVAALDGHLTPTKPPADPATPAADPAMTARLLDRLIQVGACLPDEYAVPVLTILANTAWHHGNGTVARVALDRARAADPHYVLAALLDQMVTAGVRPLAG